LPPFEPGPILNITCATRPMQTSTAFTIPSKLILCTHLNSENLYKGQCCTMWNVKRMGGKNVACRSCKCLIMWQWYGYPTLLKSCSCIQKCFVTVLINAVSRQMQICDTQFWLCTVLHFDYCLFIPYMEKFSYIGSPRLLDIMCYWKCVQISNIQNLSNRLTCYNGGSISREPKIL
jgi:hypothetical protein